MLLVVGGALLAAGLALGNLGTVYAGTQNCGRPFNNDPRTAYGACDQALSEASVLPQALMYIGIALVIGALIVNWTASREAST